MHLQQCLPTVKKQLAMLLVFLGGDLVVFGWHKARKWNVIWGLFGDKAASWNL